jgi:signal peptide peptidase SppA
MFNRFLRTVDPTQPWLLTEGALRSIMAEASGREESFDAIAKKWGEHLEGSWETQMYGDVAVIPVSGVLMKQLSWWSFLSDSSAYDMLLKEIAAALDNPQVKAVILDVDSPGGEVTGCAEVAQHIYDLRGTKPLVAYTAGNCASAAYWVASSCDEIVVSPTSLVGSIGVVKSIRDYSKAMEKAGVTEIEIVSSQSPFKRTDPASKDGHTREQRQVDALADVFIDAVARNRAVSRSEVLEGFGQGDCFVGQLAVDAGLADRIGNLEELIAELSGAKAPAATGDGTMALTRAKSTKASARIAAKANEEDKDLAEDEDEDLPAAEDDQDTDQAEGEDDNTDAEGEDDDVDAEGDEEDAAEGDDEDPDAEDEEDAPKSKSKAKASGEKARISGILRHAEASGRGELAEYLAFDTNMSVSAAAKILKAAPKAGASKGKLGAAMAGKNPSIRPGSASAKSEDEKAVAALAWAAKHLQGA